MEAAHHRQHAPPGEGAAAPRAAGPGQRPRPAHDAAARPHAARRRLLQGDGARRAQDARPQLRDAAQAPRRRDRRLRVGRHPLRPLRRLLAQAPPALRRRDPQPQARALVSSHPGGGGDAAGGGDPRGGPVDAGEPERHVPQHHQQRRVPGRVREEAKQRGGVPGGDQGRRRPVQRLQHPGLVPDVDRRPGQAHRHDAQPQADPQDGGHHPRGNHRRAQARPRRQDQGRRRRRGRRREPRRRAHRPAAERRLRLPTYQQHHQGHHTGHVRWRHGDVGFGHGVGDVRAHAEPAGDEEAAGAHQGGVPWEDGGDGGRPAGEQPPVHEAGDQGGPAAAPAGAAAGAPGEHRGVRAGRVHGASQVARHHQRVGHRPRPQVLGGRRRVQAGAVRGRLPGLHRRQLRVPALRLRPQDVPRLQLRPRQHGARLRRPALPLRLVAARGRHGGRHGGGAWTRRPPPHAAGALRHPVRPGRRLASHVHRHASGARAEGPTPCISVSINISIYTTTQRHNGCACRPLY